MPFQTPKQAWEFARGRAKRRVFGMEANLRSLISSSRSGKVILSQWELDKIRSAVDELSRVTDRWNKTTREEREFYVLRHS